MNAMAHIVMLGWVPFVVVLFTIFRPRHAVIVAFIGAWLFLPMGGYDLPGFPDYTKMFATTVGVLFGTILFDARRLSTFQPRWFDTPVVVFCLSAFITAWINGLGLYEATSATVENVVIWALPYLIGRVYFNDVEGLRELAIGIFVGGLIYMPFALWEVRMSPQLHRQIYGWRQHSFLQQMRFGGFRPMVFMEHGLTVAMWFTIATLSGAWMWYAGRLKRLWGVPTLICFLAACITLVFSRTVGAWVLFIAGAGTLFGVYHLRSAFPLIVLVMLPIGYMTARTVGGWSGEQLVTMTENAVNPGRAQSLEFRLHHEGEIADRAMKRPLFGWGRFGRWRIRDEATGRDRTVSDGFWVITLGSQGLVGLASVTAIFVVPVVMLARRLRPVQWRDPRLASAVVLAVVVAVSLINNLPNANANPVVTVAIGALATFAASLPPRRARSRADRKTGLGNYQHPATGQGT